MFEAVSQWLAAYASESVSDWFQYLTNGKHLMWYSSVRFTFFAAVFGAMLAILFGLLGAAARRSAVPPVRWLGLGYTTMVRGIPDVLFFLFFPLAFEQTVEFFLSQQLCTAEQLASQKWPPCQAAQWYLTTTEYFVMACVSLGLVYGAFAANVVHGAMNSVPKGQLEAARAYGFNSRQILWHFQIRQMWVYALPGLSNVWMLLLKATSLLSILQIADIVLWAERIGAPNYFPRAGLVHPDWRWRYYFVLFIFYILLTLLSERFFKYLQRKAGRGMALNNQ
ncbi:MAG: ABC transporter permease subunit [Granulosicoccus sp.]